MTTDENSTIGTHEAPRTKPAQRQRLETQDLRLAAFSERDPDQCGRWLILAADEIDRLRNSGTAAGGDE